MSPTRFAETLKLMQREAQSCAKSCQVSSCSCICQRLQVSSTVATVRHVLQNHREAAIRDGCNRPSALQVPAVPHTGDG